MNSMAAIVAAVVLGAASVPSDRTPASGYRK